MIDRDRQRRPRKPVVTFVFGEQWGTVTSVLS